MKKIIYTLIAVCSLSACDLLDQEPSTSVSTSTAITSVEDLSYAVNGAYYLVTYDDMGTMASELSIYGDLIGPDSYQPASSGQNASKIATFTLSSADTDNAYYYLYKALANVNKALEAADELEGEDGVESLKAELYAMRGLFHFHLATFFAPLPTSGSSNTMGIVLSNQVFPIDYIGARATVDETYEQIINDFTLAIESGENQDLNTGHLNYWAAKALRARAYLYSGKYDLALADAKDVIENSPYTLYSRDSYKSVWSQEGTSEMIFEYLQTDTYNAQRYAPGYYTSPDGYAEYGVSEDFVKWIQSDAKDIRGEMVSYLTGRYDGYFPLKYPGKSGSSAPLYNNNIKVIRLSEVYLIAAEAALKSNADDAANYINELRKNRITDYTDVTSVTEEDVLNERRKELFAEGQIGLDYWRNGKTITQASGKVIKPTDNIAVLPLPKTEIDYAKGVLVQNPGYGGNN